MKIHIAGFLLLNCITGSSVSAFSTSSSYRTPRVRDTFPSTTRSESTAIHSSTSTLPDFRDTTTLPKEIPAPQIRTFAHQVEQALLAKFPEEEIQNVITSWRLLDQDYQHREYFGDTKADPLISNQYQFAHSYVPGLSVKPFWDIDNISWAKKLQQNYKQILKEFTSVIDNKEKLAAGNNVWAGALTEEAGGYGKGWSTLVLKDRGIWDETNCNLFPKTAKLIQKSGVPATEVFFASMKPHSEIKLHSDFTNFVLTSHLALQIPQNGENKCRLTIGDEVRQWKNGEVMVFDTSLMHDAINETDETRYILMFRIWHPDLTEVERDALQLIYDCLSVPELLDENEAVRLDAEQQMQVLKQFPLLKTGGGSGFGGAKKSTASKKKKKGKK
ncbi:hypothetical protein CTEN210_13294 [Chaetoceros tenuissimus]|uniref:Aspartyl/asparaginy/proline hydroxylase domain-containing protein n=1 Tax=Chaetoceros tenuissimus TaxID=426638 RepID=A0AAD3D341_9STRA|nr:hypothetical protein CTEN210_13294 [Chaetoceros tenuissimus]